MVTDSEEILVAEFSEEMLRKIQERSVRHGDSWKTDSWGVLLDHLRKEWTEVLDDLMNNDLEAVMNELVDVANCAMLARYAIMREINNEGNKC